MNDSIRVVLFTIAGVVFVELVVYLLGQYVMNYYDPTNSSDRDSK